MLLEAEQSLETMALDSVFRESGLFETEAGDLLLEVVVLLAGVAKVDVVGPAGADVVAETMEEPFEWSNGGDGPVPEKRDTAAVRRTGFDRTANLDGEADGLGEKDRDQDQNVLIACNKRFHALE